MRMINGVKQLHTLLHAHTKWLDFFSLKFDIRAYYIYDVVYFKYFQVPLVNRILQKDKKMEIEW